MPSLEVLTHEGVYQGMTEAGVSRFYGIPYARAVRFEKPTAVLPFEGVHSALSYGPCCPQFRAYHDDETLLPFYYHEFREGLKFTYSEDCLNLNIYAPSLGSKHPVILFFHGGSFTRGSEDEKPMDGTAYAQKGVVMVMANYRLNIFGFGVKDASPHNLALWDMFFALAWVKKNIEAFGGDPDKITLMGQSAGAIGITALLYNPEIAPNVQGAILLSGGGFRKGLFAPHSKGWIDRFCQKLPAGYERLESQNLFLAYEEQAKKDKFSLFAFSPCYDGELIRKKDHKKHPLPPLILGMVHNDIVPSLLRKEAATMAKENPGTYRYYFPHKLPDGEKSNFHSCDLWYALGSYGHCYRAWQEADKALSEKMVSYFANFAASGNPNSSSLPLWDSKSVMVFD